MNKQIIEITSKDNRYFVFSLNYDDNKTFDILKKLCFPSDQNLYANFATVLKSKFSKSLELRDGWRIYDPKKEYKRQNIDFSNEEVKFVFYLFSIIK